MASGKAAWNEGGKQLREGAKYIEANYGDFLQNIANQVNAAVALLREYVLQAWRSILQYLNHAWESSKPHFQQLGKVSGASYRVVVLSNYSLLQMIIEKSLELIKFLQDNFPVYMEMISQALADLVQFTVNTWQKITDAF